jgi:uncharacterized sporulation protein YeaH/YhbH (DUF444 family)
MHVIDRRKNPQGKSLSNRQRFIERAKADVRRAVQESVANRKVADIGTDGKVKVRTRNTSEPSFRGSQSGRTHHVAPGNRTFEKGDTIARPQGENGGGRGRDASTDGGEEDEFEFTLTREEFLDVFFEDLELPHLEKTKLGSASSTTPARAGITTSGSPSSLNIVRTMRNGLARRIALRRPTQPEIDEAETAVAEAETSGDETQIQAARERLATLLRRTKLVPWLDPVDVRYNRFERIPKPITRAVMFCLMDVSGSMTESQKDIAKRFFMLLHLFLETRYEEVKVVFIRHTEVAKEVDEETFFRSRESGGTIVSTALVEMEKIIEARFPLDEWNIYGAQASDGDNNGSDEGTLADVMMSKILPACQYFAYIEIPFSSLFEERASMHRHETSVWKTYEAILSTTPVPLAMKRVGGVKDIYPVFRQLFAKKRTTQAA